MHIYIYVCVLNIASVPVDVIAGQAPPGTRVKEKEKKPCIKSACARWGGAMVTCQQHTKGSGNVFAANRYKWLVLGSLRMTSVRADILSRSRRDIHPWLF